MPNDTQNLASQVIDSNQSLADALLSQNLITKEQYDDVKVKSASKGVSEDTIVESLNIVTPEKLAQAKAKRLNIPFISLDGASFSPQSIGFIPRAVAERFSLMPFAYDDKTKELSVAMSNPVDLEAVSFIREKTGLNIKTFAASQRDVEMAINQQYRQELVGEVGEALKETEDQGKIKTIDTTQIAQIIKEAPKLFRQFWNTRLPVERQMCTLSRRKTELGCGIELTEFCMTV